jgi:2-polyprenyl-6-methoxyphenol hydroxylase-like FAD-dependent oxidoreductase
MNIDFDKKYEVIIVGGGPVGMGLGIELGQRGINVAIVEKYPTLHNIPKGQNLTQRTVEHFQSWGIENELRAARVVPRDYAIGGMTSYETLLSGYHYDWMQRDLVRPFYNTENERLPQYATEQVLRDCAGQIKGIDIAYGWEGASLTQNDEGASVSIRSRQGELRNLNGSYLVGCDGSNSTIRDAAQINQTKSQHDKLMVLLVFNSTGLHQHLKRFPGKQFYCVLHPDLQGYWLFFGRVDLGSKWFFHAPLPVGTNRENFNFEDYLHRAVGTHFDVEFEHIGFWDLHIAHADNYRSGRVFVAGDAAHSHPPYGGYGINTGFEDARNLGWKLAAKLQGWGSEKLLDSYSEERHPVFASTANDFIERFIREDRKFLNTYNPEKDREVFETAWNTRNEGSSEVTAFSPNYDGSSIVCGQNDATPGASANHEFKARAGYHLAPATLSGGRNSFDELGTGFTLLALGNRPINKTELAAISKKVKLPLNIVVDSANEAMDTYGARFILVRPDQFVAWTGDSIEGSLLAALSHATSMRQER